MIADPTVGPRDQPPADNCLYVFGIVDGGRHLSAADAVALRDAEVDSAALCLAAVGSVAAVYSALDPTSLTAGEEEDLAAEQLAGLARRHDAVVRSLAAAGPVLPMRLGTLCADASRLIALLRGSTRQIVAALDSVRGCSEWSVRVSTVPAASTSSAAAVAGTGTDYLLDRRQHQRRLAEDAKAVALAAGELDAELAALAERTRERVYRADTVVARSYLVPDAARGELVRVLASISDRLRDAGCAVEVVGPLPPYSFTDVRLEVVP